VEFFHFLRERKREEKAASRERVPASV